MREFIDHIKILLEDESTTETATSEYPLLAKGLSEYYQNYPNRRKEDLSSLADRHLKRFQDGLNHFKQGVSDGQIFNQTFIEAKSNINDALDRASDGLVGRHKGFGGKWHYTVLPEEIETFYRKNDFDGMACRLDLIPGKLKILKTKAPRHEITDLLIQFYTEVLPLSEMYFQLKDKVVKRQPKPQEDIKAKYDAPEVSHSEIGKVKEILEQATIKMRKEIYDYFFDLYSHYAKHYFENYENGNKSPNDVFCPEGSRKGNIFAATFVHSLVNIKYIKGQKQYIKVPDTQDVINKAAEDDTRQIIDFFIYKNLKKLDSIVTMKGNLKEAKLLKYKVGSAGIEANFLFTFADHSSFKVTNAVVYVVNARGTRFNRFPLTFHEVILPNGMPMKQPSEERMNDVFCKAK